MITSKRIRGEPTLVSDESWMCPASKLTCQCLGSQACTGHKTHGSVASAPPAAGAGHCPWVHTAPGGTLPHGATQKQGAPLGLALHTCTGPLYMVRLINRMRHRDSHCIPAQGHSTHTAAFCLETETEPHRCSRRV
eukprot:637173-Pelagomonas_calceolata.AAC.1